MFCLINDMKLVYFSIETTKEIFTFKDIFYILTTIHIWKLEKSEFQLSKSF